MMKNFFKLFFFFLSQSVFAQFQVGLANSNYAGTNAMYLNPSTIADSKYKFYFNIGGINHSVSNNFVKWQAPFPYWGTFAVGAPIPLSLKKSISPTRVSEAGVLKLDTNPLGTPDINFADYRGGVNDKIIGNMNLDFRLLSFMTEIPKINASIGFGMRFRGMMDFRNVSTLVGQFIGAGLDSPTFSPLFALPAIANESINTKISFFHETGLTFGKVILDDGQNLLKIGGTMKYLGGILHLGIQADNTTIGLRSGGSGGVGSTRINVISADYLSMHVTSDDIVKPFIADLTLNPLNAINPIYLFRSKTAGRGLGGNLGLTYEFLDVDMDFSSRKFKGLEKTENRYRLKIGASVNDIGRIKYVINGNRGNQTIKSFEKRNFKNTTGGIPLELYGAKKLKFKQTAEPFLDNWFSLSSAFADSINLNGFRVGLPTALNINVDYKILKNVYLGAILVQNLTFLNKNYSQPSPNTLAIIPRYETKYFEASLPLLMTNRYNNFQVGLALRAGPIYLGTDHLFSTLNFKGQRGADFYLGASVPIYNKPVRKTAQDLNLGDSRTIWEIMRENLRKRKIRELHRKEMKRG